LALVSLLPDKYYYLLYNIGNIPNKDFQKEVSMKSNESSRKNAKKKVSHLLPPETEQALAKAKEQWASSLDPDVRESLLRTGKKYERFLRGEDK
jgi:hypothetical protein